MKEKKKKKADMVDDVAQLEHSNNKCYTSTFRYIQIGTNTCFGLVRTHTHICLLIPSTVSEKYYFQFFESNIVSLYFCGIQIVGGIWADKIGGKVVLGFGVVWWSIATILTPIAARVGLPFLLVVRAFMGIGEVGLFQ